VRGQWDPIDKKYVVDTGKGRALAHAKTLLAQAGYSGGGFTVDGVTTQGNPVRQAEFAVVQSSWKNVGVTFNPNFIPASKLFSDYAKGSPLHTGDFQVAMYTSVGYSDPDYLRTSVDSHFIDRDKQVHSTINSNDGGIRDKVIDNAMAKGSSTFVKAQRQKYYNIFQRRMNQMAYWINLYYRPEINTNNGRIGNWSSNPTNQGFTWNTYRWFAKAAR
jgi:ABC-type transport system substrate-binding protein